MTQTPKADKKPKTADRVSPLLRVEGLFWKLKRSVDGLVDFYCHLTSIEAPEASDMISKKADSLMSKGRYGKAIDQYSQLIQMGREEPGIYYRLGLCCEREGLGEEAEKAYQKVTALDADHVEAPFRLGLLAIKRDDARAAVEYLSAVARGNEDSFDILYNLGVAHDKLHDYVQAVEAFKKAIAVEPGYSKVHKRLGHAYDAMGRHQDAIECFKKAMELEEI